MVSILQILNKDVPVFDYRAQLYRLPNIKIDFIVPPTQKKYPNILCHEIELSGGFNFTSDIRGMVKLFIFLLRNKYSVLHWYSTKYYLIGPLLALFTLHFKNVITINGFGRVFTTTRYTYLKPFFIILFLVSSIVARKIIVQNSDDLFFVKKLLPAVFHKKLRMVYSAVLSCSGTVNIDSTPFGVINISRIMSEKGINEYLEIAKRVKAKNEKIEFTLIGESVGESYIDQKVQLYHRKGIIRYVEYTDEPIKYLLKSNIFLFTSYREGMPRVVLEAFSVGLPVFAYDVTGVREIVDHHKNGFLYPLKDINEIVDNITACYINRVPLMSFSENALTKFKRFFSVDIYIKNMEQIYTEL